MKSSLRLGFASLSLAAVVVGVGLLGAGCPSGTRVVNGDSGVGMQNPLCPPGCNTCDGAGKCHDCVPGTPACSGRTVVDCNDDSTLGNVIKTCDAANHEDCTAGACISACEAAASSHSYIACDYWPVTLLNSQLDPYFDFAVAVANPLNVGDVVQSDPAIVTVTIGNKTVATKTVAPGTVETIILPWVQAVSQNPDCTGGFGCMPSPEKSVLMANGAYHLTSTIPVTVYQFNPLEFEKAATADCQDPGTPLDPSKCHSFTNDASILLPTTALKNEYYAISRQTFSINRPGVGGSALPGFVTVVGTVDGTTVTVNSSAFVEPGTGVAALNPQGTAKYTLNKGSVLELVSKLATSPCANTANDAQATYCDLGKQYDLTGSHITADQPIAVYGGHSCTFTPYNKWACDHVEEQLTPLDTWGQKIIVVQTEPQVTGEPNVWRIVSGSAANMITFDPPSVHAALSLDAGQYIEFVTLGGFQVSGTGRIAVAQFMVGENYSATKGAGVGDPSLGLGVPVEQYRQSYDFLSPSTYTKNYVGIIAPVGATITLDDKPVGGTFAAIGGTGYGFQRLALTPGAHHATSGQGFSIFVSGVASYTSYLYVGGQNLNTVPVQ